ncbi:hypothetical protein [Iodobacter fluviatilis]|uniref:Uncharacterized protein n=1 Tax=Iodobacter fluviatilis TaxID=537 RepID=A0A7G3GD19_9NEIS|nr:hypothetical protein [Iodobacter fluviatilis]QBC45490.1 hypothetical protein C1H71_19455 [Iodobacter fluviatilis]
MHGFNQLVEDLEKAFPDDWWISSRRKSNLTTPNAYPQVQVYENALRKLDQESWLLMSQNAHEAFSQPRGIRGKNNFFSLLNEALAYEYLINEGFKNVRLVPAGKNKKSPDISYEDNGLLRYCEVKTICESDEELTRRRSGEAYSSSIYCKLSEQYLGKFDSTIEKAAKQIQAVLSTGLVYLIVNFDDLVLDNYETYRCQLAERLREKFPSQEILIRVGVSSPLYIQHLIEDRKTQ